MTGNEVAGLILDASHHIQDVAEIKERGKIIKSFKKMLLKYEEGKKGLKCLMN